MMNKKTTKRALVSSIVALMLCFSMLLGTTYAWFTDSVTSMNNIIQPGNLDIELKYAKIENGVITGWDTVQGKDNVFDRNARWEPGRAEVVYLEVSNLGSLALKYQLGVNFVETTGTNMAGESFKLSDYLVFKVVKLDAMPSAAYTRQEALAAAGTEKGIKDYNGVTTALEVGGTDYVALIVYMPESVGNEANYKTGTTAPVINLGINLFATQQANESDGFGSDYDEYAGLPWDGVTVTENLTADDDGIYHITSAADLVAMMNDSQYPNCNKYQNVVLECDINLGGKEISGFGDGSGFFDGIFDGQGYTISNFTIDASNRTYYAGLFNQVAQYSGENTVIKNLTVADATVIGPGQVGIIVGGMNGNTVVDNCKVINCTTIGVKKVGAVVGYTAGGTVTNNYAENCNVYYSEKEGSEILGYENTGSTVNNNTFENVAVVRATSVATAEDLAAVLTGADKDVVVTLKNDIDLPRNLLIGGNAGDEYKMGGADTKAITIDLNGHKLNVTTTYWSVLGTVNPDAVVTIKNGTMTSSQASGTWDSYDLTFASGNFVFENLVFEKAIALETGAVLKKVTINEIHDYYAMWITAEGQTVEIDGLIINSAGRGIKIDEQYVNTPAKATLNVSNAVFNTENKAAIVVKSVAGADITLENIDIKNVAKDPFNEVWVDEDAADYASLVNVVGGKVVVEGSVNAPVMVAPNSDELENAITNGANAIILNSGSYEMPEVNLQGKTLTIFSTEDAVIDMSKVDARNQFVTGATLVFEGVTLNFGKTNYMGLANTASLTYKNCQINGLQFLFGENVTFENCTLNSNGAEHCVWTYGAKNVTFTGCEFTYGDRGINCYSDNDVTGGKQTVNFTGCSFATENTASEGAVEINSCFFSVGIEVNMEGCTAPAYGEMAYVSRWDSTNGAKTTINIK